MTVNTAFLTNLDEYIINCRYRLINSVLVCQNDEVIFERYYNKFTPDSVNPIKSIHKSLISLTLGVCLDQGLIESLDDPIYRYLPEFGENRSPYHKLITVRHLLTMSSGIYFVGGVHYHVPMMNQLRRSGDWVAHIADVAVTALPGSKFQYKEWDVILLTAVIARVAKVSAFEICNEHIYKPLRIETKPWQKSSCGIDYTVMPKPGGGETDIEMTAGELAKIGLLMLHGGEWNGRRIISAAYIKTAVTPSEINAGYGLFWWLYGDSYGGHGFGGQQLNVYPNENAVAILQATPTPSGKFYSDVLDGIFK
jgi:CubicO group peptidase (beta-lactamase class C family)